MRQEISETPSFPRKRESRSRDLTGSVDRDLLKRAKIIAAKSETSVNALFNAELRYLVDTYETGEVSGNQNFKVLLDFSPGRCDELNVMVALASR